MTNPLVDAVAEVLGVTGYDDPRLASVVRGPRYEALLHVAADCVGAGVSAVLVAPFTAERRDAGAWERLAKQVDGFGGQARLVWLRIEADELATRLRARSAPRDADKLQDLARYVESLDLTAPTPAFIEVDATLPPADQAETIRRALG
jgi:predicted kinase